MTGYLLTALISYLIGSIPTGYLFARARGVDIRTVGSGNIGATNAFRVLGKPAGTAVLLIDALKGFLPPACVVYFFHGLPPSSLELHSMLAGLCAILGHNYTCWLHFKGGKGIATTGGALIALVPAALAIALSAFLITLALRRIVSLSSIVAAAVLPFAAWGTGQSPRRIILCAILGLLAIYKHKANIQRLLAGTEPRFGQKKNS